MAWNRPSEGAAKPAPKKPSAWRGVVAGLVVVAVALGAVCYFMIGGGDATGERVKPRRETPKRTVTRSDLAKIVEKRTGKAFEPVVTPQKKEPEDLGWYTNKMGVVKRRTSKEGFVIRAAKRADDIFTNKVESQLDAVLNTPLGAGCFDDSVPENFDEEFAYSLTNRIEITEDDPPQVAERKRRVIEAKEQLVALKNQGEDLRQLMIEQKRMLMKKAEDYQFFEQGLMELRRDGATPEEVAEYAMAAKKMMQDREIDQKLPLGIYETEAMKELDNLINPAPKEAADQQEKPQNENEENGGEKL